MPIVSANSDTIKQAAVRLRSRGLVAFPTETVYGLGADATDSKAVAGIYEAKARPQFNPLITHIADLAQAEQYGVFDDVARRLARQFWPGAMTLVVPRQADCAICALASAGLPNIALRVPNHPVAQALLGEAGRPLAAPSANLSGRLSPVTAQHVAATLPDVMILDGGQTGLGLESSIIGCLSARPLLLRKGAIARQDIETVLGEPLAELPSGKNENNEGEGARLARLAPGQLAQHYAPQASLRLNATHVLTDEALLAFGARVPPTQGALVNLSPTGDLVEAAANFFAALHALDKQADKIAIMPIPNHGLGEAINDRLTRAAAR